MRTKLQATSFNPQALYCLQYRSPKKVVKTLTSTCSLCVPLQGMSASLHAQLEAFMNSTFCAIPPDNDLSPRMLANAIVFGCVPVMFTEDYQIWDLQMTHKELQTMSLHIKSVVVSRTTCPTWRCVCGHAVGG